MVKIGDFGSVKKLNNYEEHTANVGTGLYFAPEKLDAYYDEKVDVWAMGIVLYEIVTQGEHPIDFDFAKCK